MALASVSSIDDQKQKLESALKLSDLFEQYGQDGVHFIYDGFYITRDKADELSRDPYWNEGCNYYYVPDGEVLYDDEAWNPDEIIWNGDYLELHYYEPENDL